MATYPSKLFSSLLASGESNSEGGIDASKTLTAGAALAALTANKWRGVEGTWSGLARQTAVRDRDKTESWGQRSSRRCPGPVGEVEEDHRVRATKLLGWVGRAVC